MRQYTAITTAPRQDGAEYLGRTTHSLAGAGFTQWQVFSEPCENPPAHWIVAEKRLWPWPHFHAAMREAVKSDAQRIVYAQDDIVVARGLQWFLERIWALRPDNLGVLSLYMDSFTTETDDARRDLMSDGFWELPVADFCPRGALLLVFPRRSIEQILAHPQDARQRVGTENRIRSWCMREGTSWYHYGRRSFVQHTGEISAVFAGRVMKPERVAAENWIRDASHMRPAELESPGQPGSDHSQSARCRG